MKKIILFFMAVMLSGCDTPTDIQNREHDYTSEIRRTPGLENCTYSEVTPPGHNFTLRIVRCPNSSTTTNYQEGKTIQNITVPE